MSFYKTGLGPPRVPTEQAEVSLPRTPGASWGVGLAVCAVVGVVTLVVNRPRRVAAPPVAKLRHSISGSRDGMGGDFRAMVRAREYGL